MTKNRKNKPTIQHCFGMSMLGAITRFVCREIKEPCESYNGFFKHIAKISERKAMSEVLYGARWLYKMALAFQLANKELAAHVRAQIIDYTSICEAVLGDMLRQYLKDAIGKSQALPSWATTINAVSTDLDIDNLVEDLSFCNRITYSEQLQIVSSQTSLQLHQYRKHRNSVHLSVLASTQSQIYTLAYSDEAYRLLHTVVKETQSWYKNTIKSNFRPINIK